MNNLNEDINRNKELMNIVNFSDLVDSGTWDPNVMTRLKEGSVKYYYIDGQFTTDNGGNDKSKPYYLKPEQSEILNKLIKLKEEKYLDYVKQRDLTNNVLMTLIGVIPK